MNKFLHNSPERDNQNKTLHNNNVTKQNNLLQFNDNRKESATLRNLQQNINNSERVLSLRRISNAINNINTTQLKIKSDKWDKVKKGELVMKNGKLVSPDTNEKKEVIETIEDDKYEYIISLIDNQDKANRVREIFPKGERGDITPNMKKKLKTILMQSNKIQFDNSYDVREGKNALNCTLDLTYKNNILDLKEICCNPALYNDNTEVTRIDPYADILVKEALRIISEQDNLIAKNAFIESLINKAAIEGLEAMIMKLNNFNTPNDTFNSIFNNPKYPEDSKDIKNNIITGNIEIKGKPSDRILEAINKGPVKVLKSINNKFTLKSINIYLINYEFNTDEKRFTKIGELKCFYLDFETKNDE